MGGGGGVESFSVQLWSKLKCCPRTLNKLKKVLVACQCYVGTRKTIVLISLTKYKDIIVLQLCSMKPPSVTFRQARNLKQVLVKNRLRELPYTDCSDLPPAGCFKHAHGNRGRACMLCPKLNESKQFTSTFTGLTYYIRHNLTCKSTYVVYLVTCQACSAQYTGKTT